MIKICDTRKYFMDSAVSANCDNGNGILAGTKTGSLFRNAGGMTGVSGKAVLKGNATKLQLPVNLAPDRTSSAGTRIGIYDKIIQSSS